MKKILGIIRFLYKLYFGVVYIIIGFIMYPFMYIFIRGNNKIRNGIIIKKIWSRVLCILVFVHYRVVYEEQITKDKTYIFCPNHTSYLDILLLYLILPNNIAFLGKSEILKWPIIGLFFKRGVDIPVYRDSKRKASDCLIPAAEELINNRSLVIFPEGKIPENSPKLSSFKRGAFSLSYENNIPIVPITFYNNWRLFSDHTDLFGAARPGLSKIKIHKPLYPKDFTNLLSLRDETRNIIKEELEIYGNKRRNSR